MIKTQKPVTSRKDLSEYKFNAYFNKYNILISEINALRTKTAITIGIFGVILTIILGYSLTTSYSIENLSPVLQTIYGISESFIESIDTIVISPNGISETTLLSLIVTGSLLLLGFNYFWMYIELHNLKDMLHPTNSALKNIESAKEIQQIQNTLLSDIQISTSKLYLNYNFYRELSTAFDIIFVVYLFILYTVYYILSLDSIFPENLLSIIQFIILPLCICMSLLLLLLITVVRVSRDSETKRRYIQNKIIFKLLKIGIGFAIILFSPAVLFILIIINPDIVQYLYFVLVGYIAICSYSIYRLVKYFWRVMREVRRGE